MGIDFILYVAFFIFELAAAFGWPQTRVNLGALGLACFALTFLV